MEGQKAGSKWLVLGMGGCIVALAGALVYAVAPQSGEATAHASAPPGEAPVPAAVEAAPEPTRPPSVIEQIRGSANFYAAYQVAKPYMSDSVERPSEGAIALALWFSEHGSASDIHGDGGPSVKVIKKDPSNVRGQHTCVRGNIVQIQRATDKLFEGLLMVGYGDPVHYLAAGSTGTLVEGDRARFCGVITGTYAFGNVSGGQTQSIQLVGMFDL